MVGKRDLRQAKRRHGSQAPVLANGIPMVAAGIDLKLPRLPRKDGLTGLQPVNAARVAVTNSELGIGKAFHIRDRNRRLLILRPQGQSPDRVSRQPATASVASKNAPVMVFEVMWPIVLAEEFSFYGLPLHASNTLCATLSGDWAHAKLFAHSRPFLVSSPPEPSVSPRKVP